MIVGFDGEKVILKKGDKEVSCDILFTFDCEDTMKSYIGYSNNEIASNDRKNIYISSYSPLSGDFKLHDISDQKEFDMILKVLENLSKDSEQEVNS
ncbi:MAG: DUF1292 domain-containing protein [Bacilli bacterium]|nr:DUF1292 domain-containing protein [Bacilli bacterium]